MYLVVNLCTAIDFVFYLERRRIHVHAGGGDLELLPFAADPSLSSPACVLAIT